MKSNAISHYAPCGTNKRLRIFLQLFYAMFICWAVSVAFCETQQHVFFAAGKDLFADFFNNVRYVAGRDPYFDTTIASSEHIYPPICYLLFYPFACLYKWYGAIILPSAEMRAFWSDKVAMISCSLFMLLSAIPLLWAVWRIVRKYSSLATRILLVASFLLSGIMMFSFERGNLILLASSALAMFMVCTENGRGWQWLSLAISVKIYPAMFISLLIQQRKYRQIALVVVCTMALGFLPLFFFKHGVLENSLQLMQNVKDQGAVYYNSCPPNLSVAAYVAGASRVLNLEWLVFVAKLLRYGAFVLGVFSFIGACVINEKWKCWFLAAASAILCSNFAGYYTLLYFIPAIYSYLSSDTHWVGVDWLYTIACVIWLTPFQVGLLPVIKDSVNPFISGCMIAIVATAILAEAGVKRWAKSEHLAYL